jgi:hypothetical protein
VLEQHLLRGSRRTRPRGGGVTGLQQRGQGVHLHGQDGAIAPVVQPGRVQPARQLRPWDAPIGVQLAQPGRQRVHRLAPRLRPPGGVGLDRAQRNDDAVVGEHIQVRGRGDTLGAPRPGGASQQQQPHLRLRPVQGGDQRVELAGAALGVVEHHQRGGRHVAQHREIRGGGVLAEYQRRPPPPGELPGQPAAEPGLALAPRAGHQAHPGPVVLLAPLK